MTKCIKHKKEFKTPMCRCCGGYWFKCHCISEERVVLG